MSDRRSCDPAAVTEEVGQAYEFGITSLTNKKEYLQVGDSVTFQVEQGGQRATNIKIQRKRHRATVDAFKSESGRGLIDAGRGGGKVEGVWE